VPSFDYTNRYNHLVRFIHDHYSVTLRKGLIARNMFAIDGCKIKSKASTEWNGSFEAEIPYLKQVKSTTVKKRNAD